MSQIHPKINSWSIFLIKNKIIKIVKLIFFTKLIFLSNVFSEELILSSITVNPSSGSVDSSYSISVSLKKNSPKKEIAILYQMREGSEVIPITMHRSDKKKSKAGYEIFAGEGYVPKTAALGVHKFTVFVVDDSGKKSNFLGYEFTVVEKGKSKKSF